MPRKLSKPALDTVTLDKPAKLYVVGSHEYAQSFREGSVERQAAEQYAAAVEKQERHDAWVNSKFDLDVELTDKTRPAFMKAMDEQTRLGKAVLGALDKLEYILSHTISVPEADIRQITMDALKANEDALLDVNGIDAVSRVSGIDRRRILSGITDDLLDAFKKARVVIREQEIGAPPLCNGCQEEAA